MRLPKTGQTVTRHRLQIVILTLSTFSVHPLCHSPFDPESLPRPMTPITSEIHIDVVNELMTLSYTCTDGGGPSNVLVMRNWRNGLPLGVSQGSTRVHFR